MDYSPSEREWMMRCCAKYPDPIILAQALFNAPMRYPRAGQGSNADKGCSADNPVEHLLVTSRASVMLARAIGGLRARERVVLHLIYVEKMSLDEVADLFNYGLARIYLIKRQSLSHLYKQMTAPLYDS